MGDFIKNHSTLFWALVVCAGLFMLGFRFDAGSKDNRDYDDPEVGKELIDLNIGNYYLLIYKKAKVRKMQVVQSDDACQQAAESRPRRVIRRVGDGAPYPGQQARQAEPAQQQSQPQQSPQPQDVHIPDPTNIYDLNIDNSGIVNAQGHVIRPTESHSSGSSGGSRVRQQTSKTCPRCSGNGWIPNNRIGSAGTVSCPYCGGKGYVMR